jgi:hypothetical protein
LFRSVKKLLFKIFFILKYIKIIYLFLKLIYQNDLNIKKFNFF